MAELEFFVADDGVVECIHSDAAARLISPLGPCVVRRASYVEPAADGRWYVDLTPSGGPVLGPFPIDGRADALAAELAWLRERHLSRDVHHDHQDQDQVQDDRP